MLPQRTLQLGARRLAGPLRTMRLESTAVPKTEEVPRKKPQNNTSKKVREISRQVNQSVERATPLELLEALDILEEGTAYLREVQAEEKIPERDIYRTFQPVIARLFDKMFEPGASFGNRSLAEVVDMLAQQKVAHRYHFARAAQHFIGQAPSQPELYNEVLALWLKFAEYQHSFDSGRGQVFNYFASYKERGYQQPHFKVLVYFAYVMLCLKTDAIPLAADLLKILAAGDGQALIPDTFHVKRTLSQLGLTDALLQDFQLFQVAHKKLKAAALDPNSEDAFFRIEKMSKAFDSRGLNAFYRDMCQASADGKPMQEKTLNRVMMAFIEVGSYGRVFDVFSDMISGGLKNPTANTFDLVFKALGHPDRLSPLTAKQKAETVHTVDATRLAMKQLGLPMNARTLGYIVLCYANIDRFDKIEPLLKAHPEMARIDFTKNNILVGLLLNDHVAEAETKLKAYLAEDPLFSPYTLTMNRFLAYYTRKLQFLAVEGILKFMKEKNIPEDVATVTTVVDFYFKLSSSKGQLPDIPAVMRLFKDRKDIDFSPSTVNTILDTLTQNGSNLAAARAVFKHFSDQTPKYKFSPAMNTTMFRAELNYGLFFNAEDLFNNYVKNIRSDTRIWNMMIRGCLNHDAQMAKDYFYRLVADRSVRPNYFTFYFMLDYFASRNMTEQLQWAVDELAKANLTEFGDVLPKLVSRIGTRVLVPPDLALRISQLE